MRRYGVIKTKDVLVVGAAFTLGGMLFGAQAAEFDMQEADTHDRMTYHRAIDAAVWAMPLMNFKFYLDLAETPENEWLDGGKTYKLVMPPNVPVEDFWSITTYDLETASYLRNIAKSSIDSTMKDVKRNADGSVDIYFGPKPEKGK